MRSMKTKAVIASTAALLLLGFTMAAEADFVTGSLGTSINATDVFSVQCGIGTTSVGADVDDNGGAGDGVRMRVTLVDLRGQAVSQVSPDNNPSALAVLSGGPGHYLVIIQRAADVAPLTSEAYDSFIICANLASGTETVTNVLLIQNR